SLRRARAGAAGEAAGGRGAVDRTDGDPLRRCVADGRRALRRQPAEGRDRAAAAPRRGRLHPRRADPRHRRRQQGADLPADRLAGRRTGGRTTPRGLDGQQLPARAAGFVRSHRRHAARTPPSAAPRRRPDRARSDDAGDRGRRRMTARSILDRTGTLVGLILVAAIFGALVGRQFFAADNLELMARQTAMVCMSALGMTVVIAAGGIDLSVGSIIALTTVVIALALRADRAPLVAAAAGGAAAAGRALGDRVAGDTAAAACGLVNGVLITRLRVVPFIVTLGTMLVVRGAAKGLAEERRIEAPITWLNDLLRSETGRLLVPPGSWTLLVVALLIGGLLGYTRL